MESEELFLQSCRICSSDRKHGVMLFGEQGKKQYLQAKIRKYLYVTVTAEDKLPKMICEECCKRIEGIHKFATMAVKNQDKLKKLVSESNFNHRNEEAVESKGLLHTYLTKGIKDQNSQQDPEITEMEVKVDPMLFLQCGSDDDESTRDAESDCESESEVTTSKNNGSTEVENGCDESSEQYRKPYQCSYCPRGFTSDFALQGHVWNHLPQNRPMVFSNLNNSPYSWQDKQDHNKYTVARSNSTTSSDGETSENGNRENSQLDSDIQGGFKCPICGKPISTKGNLKVHLETHRPKGKYGCDSCGRIFKTQCNLHRHKEYHGGIQYTCDVCGRVYPTNSTLRAHSITHSDLRPHKCPLCVKTFKRNQDLKFHINQHTGARPYRCPYCPKAFASSGNCFSHRKRMHPMEVERDREKAAKIMR